MMVMVVMMKVRGYEGKEVVVIVVMMIRYNGDDDDRCGDVSGDLWLQLGDDGDKRRLMMKW